MENLLHSSSNHGNKDLLPQNVHHVGYTQTFPHMFKGIWKAHNLVAADAPFLLPPWKKTTTLVHQ